MRCAIRMGLLALSCLAPLLSSGCVTAALWNSINPHDYVWVPSSEVTEAELAKKGLDYKKTDDPVAGYSVEKTDFQKAGDYTALAVLTPLTVALDVAIVCGVVCAFMVYCGCSCCP
jgi:hypothetical protein